MPVRFSIIDRIACNIPPRSAARNDSITVAARSG